MDGSIDRSTNITAWPRTRTRTRTRTGTHLSCRHKLRCCFVPWETRGKKTGTKPKARMGIQERTNTCPPNSHRCVRTNRRWIDDVDLPLVPTAEHATRNNATSKRWKPTADAMHDPTPSNRSRERSVRKERKKKRNHPKQQNEKACALERMRAIE